MKSLEEFYHERKKRAVFEFSRAISTHHALFELHPELRQAANRALEIFPVPDIAGLVADQTKAYRRARWRSSIATRVLISASISTKRVPAL